MRFWFGRILTFEIFGDEEPPTVSSILADASGQAVLSDVSVTVHGYAAYGVSRRAAVQPLIDQFVIPLLDDGIAIRSPAASVDELEVFELGCAAGEGGDARHERSQSPAGDLPRSLSLSYYDPERDYQTGQMRATAASVHGIDEAVELPAAIGAGQAKALAETHIAQRWARRDSLMLRLPLERLGMRPGSLVQMDDGAVWRTEQVTVEDMVVRASLSPVSQGIANAPADAGTHLPAPDLVASPTDLVVLDLPDLGIGRHDVPVLQVAACQPSAGWRPVPVEVTIGGGVRVIASAQGEAIIGIATNALAAGSSLSVDEANVLEVELADEDHWLESRDDEALGLGANLAAVGSELVQFGRAISIGPRRFRLEHLLRGRFGSEWAVASHGPNEAFVLIQPGALQEVVLPPSAIGTTVSIRPRGLADDNAPAIERVVTGEAMRPPAPVDLHAEMQDGTLSVAWTRRSRLGWDWPGDDVPLGEARERYRVTLQGFETTMTFEVAEPHLAIPSDGISGMVTVTVVQLGDFAESRPASLSLEI